MKYYCFSFQEKNSNLYRVLNFRPAWLPTIGANLVHWRFRSKYLSWNNASVTLPVIIWQGNKLVFFLMSCCSWSHGLQPKKLSANVAMPPVPVRVPTQRPCFLIKLISRYKLIICALRNYILRFQRKIGTCTAIRIMSELILQFIYDSVKTTSVAVKFWKKQYKKIQIVANVLVKYFQIQCETTVHASDSSHTIITDRMQKRPNE